MELTHCAKLGKSAPDLIFALLLLSSFSLAIASEQPDITGTYVSEITTSSPRHYFKRDTRKLKLRLEQHGSNITGTDVSGKAEITGIRKGDTVTFEFFYSKASNELLDGVWKISADGTTLEGSWIHTGGAALGGRGQWNLTKIDGATKEPVKVEAATTSNQSEPAKEAKKVVEDEERKKLEADMALLAAEMNKLEEEKRKFAEEKRKLAAETKKRDKSQQILIREMVAAENGNATTQMKLADRYYSGDGVEQDYSEAFTWYSKAANQGIAVAQLFLGNMYLKGQGVEQNNSKAVEWLDKAAKQGNDEAKDNILEAQYKLSVENRENEKVMAKRVEAEKIAAEKSRIKEKRRAEAKAQAEARAKAVAAKRVEEERITAEKKRKEGAKRKQEGLAIKQNILKSREEAALEKYKDWQYETGESASTLAIEQTNGVGADLPVIMSISCTVSGKVNLIVEWMDSPHQRTWIDIESTIGKYTSKEKGALVYTAGEQGYSSIQNAQNFEESLFFRNMRSANIMVVKTKLFDRDIYARFSLSGFAKASNRVNKECETTKLAFERKAQQERRKAKVRRELERAVERQKQEAASNRFTAKIWCGSSDGRNFNLLSCFIKSSLNISKKGISRTYQVHDVGNAGEMQHDGLYIDLPKNFRIVGQNSFKGVVLGIKVFDANNELVYEDQAGYLGVISVRN